MTGSKCGNFSRCRQWGNDIKAFLLVTLLLLTACSVSEDNSPGDPFPNGYCKDFDPYYHNPACTVCWGPIDPVTGERPVTYNSCEAICQYYPSIPGCE